jgi:myo-inositol-1(or 4)-monophosphatase
LPDSEQARLRGALEAVMREAGELARRTLGREFKRWTKGDDRSPVCEGDIEVNKLLHARLPPLAPGAGWLSEETEDSLDARATARAWIVDPIDGTRAYISGRPDWTISVALVEDGRPALAALYAPASEEMFLAERGKGARLNGAPLAVSPGALLAGAKLAGPKRYLDRLNAHEPAAEPQPKIHSLALRFARVAQGTLQAAFASPGSHDWDLAAADLLVHEAGGLMTDLSGAPLRYNTPRIVHGALIAAGVARHRALIDLVRDRVLEFA